MAQFRYIDGILYIYRDASDIAYGDGTIDLGVFRGVHYYFHPSLGFYEPNRYGRPRNFSATTRWATSPLFESPFAGLDADPLDGLPVYVWDQVLGGSSAGSIASYQIDQRRWLRVTLYINEGEDIEIPLIDDNDVPWIGVDQPWSVVCRQRTDSTDRVLNPGASDVHWYDDFCCVRSGSSGLYAVVEWSLHAKSLPVPHWELRISRPAYGTPANQTNVVFDILGSGFGAHASSTREEGSASTSGHWQAELMWTQQAFNSATVRATHNERIYLQGALDVANDPTFGSGYQTVYLTTGANEGLSSGTTEFSELPMVQVLGHADLGTSVAASAETTWKPSSLGMGLPSFSGTASNYVGLDYIYESRVYLDSISGEYAVDIWNSADDGTGAANSSLDRTYFIFAVGK